MRGVSDLARMTPEAVEEKYGVPPAALPRARGHRGRDLRQPAGRAGRRPGLRREVDQPVRRPRQRHRPRRRDHRQEGRGAARPPRRRDPQPPAQRAGPRPRPRARARPTWRCSRGTGTTALHALRRARVPRRAAHPHSRHPRARGGRRSTRAASSWPGGGSAPARWPPCLGGASAGDARRRRTSRAPGGAGTGEVVSRRRSPTADGQAAWVDVAELDPRRRRRPGGLAGRPGAAQGAPRRQGARARAGRARLGARGPGRATPPSRPTSSSPTSAPTTSPT